MQKRACEYVKLLDRSWESDRRSEVNIPVPIYKASAESFNVIPVGDTTLELDMNALKMPEKVDINYNESKVNERVANEEREIVVKRNVPQETPVSEVKVETKKKPTSLLDDDDDFFGGKSEPQQIKLNVEEVKR